MRLEIAKNFCLAQRVISSQNMAAVIEITWSTRSVPGIIRHNLFNYVKVHSHTNTLESDSNNLSNILFGTIFVENMLSSSTPTQLLYTTVELAKPRPKPEIQFDFRLLSHPTNRDQPAGQSVFPNADPIPKCNDEEAPVPRSLKMSSSGAAAFL